MMSQFSGDGTPWAGVLLPGGCLTGLCDCRTVCTGLETTRLEYNTGATDLLLGLSGGMTPCMPAFLSK